MQWQAEMQRLAEEEFRRKQAAYEALQYNAQQQQYYEHQRARELQRQAEATRRRAVEDAQYEANKKMWQ